MKALIISLNFHPGHVSHMVASYKQCEELGYESEYYVSPLFVKYLPQNSRIILNSGLGTPKADLAIFLFPSQKNLFLIWKLKKEKTKIVYIFHEPLAPIKVYRRAGFSISYLIKLWIINRVSSMTVRWSDIILLPSLKAIKLYEANRIYNNPNYHYMPLMYDDECADFFSNMKRSFLSYIGTIAADHSFQEFLDFVCWVLRTDKLPCLNFMVATKSTFVIPEEMKNNPRVQILQGRPLSDLEINKCYAVSYCVWNAYARTTQSGVLAKSFMFGTPAIVLKENCNEFAHDGIEIKAVSSNKNYEEISMAVEQLIMEFETYSQNCRQRFEHSFYYRNYNSELKKLLQ